MILQILPYVGPVTGIILWMYSVLTGIHYLYKISRFKSALLLFLPLLAFISFITIIIIAGIVGGMISGISQMLDWMNLFNLN
jgi:hypothetical protein